MAYENNDKKADSVYSQRVRAGKRRTYFFDVRETRGNDYYLTITESRKKFNEDGYDRHKIFLYKEDFNKFLKGITEAIDYVKTELMPDFDFDVFSHENDDYQPRVEKSNNESDPPASIAAEESPEVYTEKEGEKESANDVAPTESNIDSSHKDEHVDKW